jgi:hypothetical protein
MLYVLFGMTSVPQVARKAKRETDIQIDCILVILTPVEDIPKRS